MNRDSSSLEWQYIGSPSGWWKAERLPWAWIVAPEKDGKWSATRVGRGSMTGNGECLGLRDSRERAFALCEQDADRLSIGRAA